MFDVTTTTIAAVVEGETDVIANMANIAALLYHTMGNVNWVGFYRFDGRELVLGPFQGLPACVRIGLGKGVCGTAAAERRTVVVDDVHAFPGHIACDAASRSEVVVPIIVGDRLIGVLDVDSPLPARFSASDVAFCEDCVRMLIDGSTWTDDRDQNTPS